MTKERMGLRVAIARESLHLTQQELAERTSISRVTISKIENGRVEDISTRTLLRLAEALNVSAGYLLCG